MKKFLCSTLISLLVITPGLSTSAFADTNYSINTIESLEETLEANKDSINKYQLIKETDPTVLKTYYKTIEEEINNKINNLEKINVCLDLNSKLDDKINTYTIPINDGEIILEYKLTQNESPLREYVSYGSYTLELTAKITHLTYPDTILC